MSSLPDKATRRAAAVVSACLLLLCLASVPAAASELKPTVGFGAYLPGLSEHPNKIAGFGKLVGRDPVIVSEYMQWDSPPFEASELNDIWEHGAVPMITWEPFSYEGQKFPLRLIDLGRYDSYIRESARAAREWGHPILRFAHEMNGDWYPWGRGVEGNTPQLIRAVWRRLVRLFREEGANNVQWVWTPNVNSDGRWPFRDLYPGDRWVDWVGFDAFNWARGGEWNSFTELVARTYEELSQISDRPMIVAETGSSDSGGDKAAWVSSALNSEIPHFPRIHAVVWFDERFEGSGGGFVDARVNSSAEALKAFKAGISSPHYALTRAEFLATPPRIISPAAKAPPPPSGGFGQPSLFYRLTHKLHDQYIVYAAAIGAAALVLLALATRLLVRRRRRHSSTRAIPSAGAGSARS